MEASSESALLACSFGCEPCTLVFYTEQAHHLGHDHACLRVTACAIPWMYHDTTSWHYHGIACTFELVVPARDQKQS